ncbi:MAG: phosphate acetyltransferase [Maricaulis sp.]|jgi:acyl dehydratase|nr:phosphate acetyltransferase [Maricaulis sp.]|tara:strand:- start:686 stop:1045 length:360 start_codon:yes stop_codon:yes gene_type:complete
MKLGQSAEITRTFTVAEVAELAALAGTSPAATIVPEPLVHALFSHLLGVELPGQGTNYLKQETAYLAAAPLGEALTARVEITRLRPEKHLVDLKTTCTTADGTLIAEGRALVLARDVAR